MKHIHIPVSHSKLWVLVTAVLLAAAIPAVASAQPATTDATKAAQDDEAKAKAEAEAQAKAKAEAEAKAKAKAEAEAKAKAEAEAKAAAEAKERAEEAARQKAEAKEKAEAAARKRAEAIADEKKAEAEKKKVHWKWGVRLRPRSELFLNRDFDVDPVNLNYPLGPNKPDSEDFTTQQTRLNIHARRGRLTSGLDVQTVHAWGTTGGDSLTDPTVSLHEGWFQYGVKRFDIKVGRQELAYGDHRVMGDEGWSQASRAWDGAKLRVRAEEEKDASWVDLIAAQYADGFVERPASAYANELFDEDQYVLGAYASLTKEVRPALDTVDVYVLNDLQIESQATDTGGRRNLVTIGTRLKGKWSSVDATLEGAFQTGSSCVTNPNDTSDPSCTNEKVTHKAYFVDTEVGTNIKPVRVFVGFSQASGDDPTTADDEGYFQMYPTAHRFLGLMDVIGGRSNIREMRGGLKLKFAKKMLATVTVHDFTRLEPEAKRVGLELDATVKVPLIDGLCLVLGHGTFVPDKGITADDAEPQGTSQWWFTQAVFQL